MDLPENESMLNVNSKNAKKSIYPKLKAKSGSLKPDIFLIIAAAVLISCPFVMKIFFNKQTESKQINLYISSAFNEIFGNELTETILNEYIELNPGLQIRIPGGNNSADAEEPDILLFDDGGLNSFLKDGMLLNLESVSDQPFAVPLVSFMDLLFYNIDILSAAGFDRPPKTRDEFLAAAKAVSENLNIPGAALSLGSEDKQALSRDVFSWMWAAGGDFWSSDEKKPALNLGSAEADITFLKNLYRGNYLAPGIFRVTGKQGIEDFAGGRTAMMIASTQAIPLLREKMGDSAFGITTIPVPGTGKYNISLSGIYAGINVNCEYKEEALDFLAFLADQRLSLCGNLKAVPGVVSDIIPGDYIKDDIFFSKAQNIFEYSAIIRGFSGNPRADEYENAFLEELRSFFETSRTPQETINAIQQKWDRIQ